MSDNSYELISSGISARGSDEEPEKIEIDLSDYQVTRGEFFAHTREPSISIWGNRIKFNMACIRQFPGVFYIQLLINPQEKRLVVRPSSPEAPDSFRWARGGGEKEIAARDLLCKIFSEKVFDLMAWDKAYRYKIMGNIAKSKDETLFLFKLTDFEFYINSGKTKDAHFPGEWRDYFGIPFNKHEESFKIDLADGYITAEKV